jgi:hypothetical protein
MEQTFDVDFFINFFEPIPEENWCTGRFISDAGACCANGHIGVTMDNQERAILGQIEIAKQLQILLSPINLTTWCMGFEIMDEGFYSVKAAGINNGKAQEYQQPTPKQRILAALYDIKANQAVKEAESILEQPIVEKRKLQIG